MNGRTRRGSGALLGDRGLWNGAQRSRGGALRATINAQAPTIDPVFPHP
jgi:hypothetical protein